MALCQKGLPLEFNKLANYYLQGPFLQLDVDFIICTETGYLLELKGKSTRNACKLPFKNISELSIWYRFLDSECHIHYVLRSVMNELAVVHRQERHSKVVAIHSDVTEFKITDSKLKGQPQLLIWKLGFSEPEELSDFEDECLDEPGMQNKHSEVTGSLERACMEMKIQLDTLKEELYLKESVMKRHHQGNTSLCLTDIAPFLGDVVPSVQADVLRPPTLVLKDSWQCVHADMWVIGFLVHNSSDRVLDELQLLPKEIADCEFRYKITLAQQGEPYEQENCKTIPFGSSAYVTVISSLSEVWNTGSLSRHFELRCQGDWIDTPVFTITSFEILQGTLDFFSGAKKERGLIRKDFISLLHTHIMTSILVNIPIPCGTKSLEDIVTEDFRMKKLTKLGRGYLYCDKGPLDGLLLLVPENSQLHSNIDLKIWVREAEQLFLLVFGLYDVLPIGSTITCCN